MAEAVSSTKTVFVAGIFDMLHKGHLELLRMMNEMGDRTVVILHDDHSCFLIKDKFPVQDWIHRKRNLELSGLVDEIGICTETDPASHFKKVASSYADVAYVRGDDLTEDFPGKYMLDRLNIPILFKEYTKGVSSTKIRDSL